MPRKSERAEFLDELKKAIDCAHFTDCEEEDAFIELYSLALSSRYLNERVITKRPRHFYEERFPTLSNEEFRSMFRVTRGGFSAILKKIENNPVFTNGSRNRQAPVELQLAVTLARLGSKGTGATVGKMQDLFGIATGTATVYTNRVLQALWDIKSDWIKWPNENRRAECGQRMRAEGFPNCVGFIGGATLPLSQKPGIDGYDYIDRMDRYSVAMQVICDVDKRIINVLVGYPGSCSDCHVFKEMSQYKSPHRYFSPGEYLLANSAYELSNTIIPSYGERTGKRQDNAQFNYCHAKSYVRIKHCMGILKSRWRCLQEMRQQLRSKEEMQVLIRWVMGCCVLHNMLAHFGDEWDEMVIEEDPCAFSDPDMPRNASQTARNFRETLKKTTLETNKARGNLK